MRVHTTPSFVFFPSSTIKPALDLNPLHTQKHFDPIAMFVSAALLIAALPLAFAQVEQEPIRECRLTRPCSSYFIDVAVIRQSPSATLSLEVTLERSPTLLLAPDSRRAVDSSIR